MSKSTCHQQLKTSTKMTSTEKRRNTEKNQKKQRQLDLPLVAILHDAVLNGVQGKRLGQSYGFDVIKQKTEKTDDINQSVKSLESIT